MLSNCTLLAAECDEAKKKATAIIAHLWQALSAVNSLFDPPQLAGTFSHTLDPLTQRSVDDALKLAREWLESQWGIPVPLPDRSRNCPGGRVVKDNREYATTVTLNKRDIGCHPDATLADKVRQPQSSANGAAAIYGQWPGDESEEQLLKELDEMDGKKPAA